MQSRAKIIKVQASTRCFIKHRRYLQIRRGVIQLQSCGRRLFLFANENDIADELLLDAMELRCKRVNSKFINLQRMIIILNLLHEKGFY
jgi:hypothetical protein